VSLGVGKKSVERSGGLFHIEPSGARLRTGFDWQQEIVDQIQVIENYRANEK